MKKYRRKVHNEELRAQAEQLLDKIAADNDVEFPHEIKRILHELQVYRVELEMQYDELEITQRELEKSRNRLAILYDHAPVGYFSLNAKGDILMLNITAARMLGYSRSALIGQNINKFIATADQDFFYLFMRNVFSGPRKQTLDVKLYNKKKIPIYAQLEAVLSDEDDTQVKQCRVAMLDITERKMAEIQLKEREASLREAQEMAHLGSWSLDLENGKVKSSAQLYSILGLRRSEKLDGEILQSFVHPDDKERVQQLYDKLKLDGKPASIEYRVILRDGMQKWLYSSNKASIDSFSRVRSLSGFIQDITEQKAANELQIEKSKLETANAFARTITHEVRNPLTTVNLSLSLLRSEAQKTGNDKLSNYIATIDRNIKRVDQLITQLLYSSRPSESIFSKVHICDLLDDVLAEATDRISLSGTTLVKNYHTNCTVKIDAESMKIAFLSLVINAIEAIKHTEGIVTLITEQRDHECFITIRDNGTGIDPALTEKIFEAFYTTKTDGMGLGLSNTKNIIETNSGKIILETEVGVGTSFIISLPAM